MIALETVKPNIELMTPEHWFMDMPKLIEKIGRLSHKSENKITKTSADKFNEKIALKLGHESILEHCSVTYKLTCSRACSHQLVRHRIAAYTQSSQRYCDYAKGDHKILKIIVPPSILEDRQRLFVWRTGLKQKAKYQEANGTWSTEQEDINPWRLSISRTLKNGVQLVSDISGAYEQLIFFHSTLTSYECYLSLRERGIKAEDARFVLPNATQTEIATTFNIRMWRHVIKERGLNKYAQWEIRELFQAILSDLVTRMSIFNDLKND